ncbi:beta-N-acetylhexosaminidase [Marinithermofilum abyssi]|uniref:beta-N-acetylhexosaminidase n=1 Tax=Marinithermofilum abyssi TaxID=1571185 RepID=A0A8J2YF90_9BACL|nr:glycoside hydrolase family 3 protein [Marinithermofilum abyssi]GGE28855.1 beta-N-acetylhexosaminidase [Marinithermofilum abyssi]
MQLGKVGSALLSAVLALPLAISPGSVSGATNDVDTMVDRLSLEEKVGQMTMVGFYGDKPNEEIRRLIQDAHAGNVILFSYSGNVNEPKQTAELTNGLQQMAEETPHAIPLLISTDQEGGVVARMTTGATELPGNMALGAGRKSSRAFQAAQLTGEELRAVGINMNLAPVLDVNVNPANPVIGVRSFSENPDVVADMGAAQIKGYQQNVVATAKHFPGHGDTDVDSHVGLPVIEKSREELEKVEFVPFKRAIAEGIDAIMTAHIHVPALDDTPDLPATLSKPILTGLLRKEMGYNGLIITDSMTMAGVADYFGGVPKAAVKAVDAGADIILLSPALKTDEQIDVMKAVTDAVRAGEIPEERIDQSVRRILKVKMKYGLFQNRQVDVNQVQAHVGTPEHQEKAAEIARHSITLVKNQDNLLPLQLKPEQKLGVISQFSIKDWITPYHANVTEIHHRKTNPTDAEIQQAVEMAKQQDVLIIGTYSASLYPQQVKLVKELEQLDKPMAVIAMRNPYDIEKFPEVDAYITTYGYRSVSLKAAVDTLFGANQPKGKLPVTIPGLYPYGHGLSYEGANQPLLSSGDNPARNQEKEQAILDRSGSPD